MFAYPFQLYILDTRHSKQHLQLGNIFNLKMILNYISLVHMQMDIIIVCFRTSSHVKAGLNMGKAVECSTADRKRALDRPHSHTC